MKTTGEQLKRLLKDEEGPTSVEYVIIIAGMALVILAAVWLFGGTVSNKFDDSAKLLQNGPK